MVEMEERALLLQGLKDYLVELRDSGVDELAFAESVASLPSQARDEVRDEVAQVSGAAKGEECLGVGDPHARLLFVMNGAGFAGAAGELLVNIIKAMGFAASEVYLLSYPVGSSGTACVSRDTLASRIAAVAPEIVVTLGEGAAQLLLDSRAPITALRGKFHDLSGVAVLPTLHPEALVQDQSLKREVWGEMQQVMRRLAAATPTA